LGDFSSFPFVDLGESEIHKTIIGNQQHKTKVYRKISRKVKAKDMETELNKIILQPYQIINLKLFLTDPSNMF
jgi:hypothetical protein